MLRAINAALFIDDYNNDLGPILGSVPPILCLSLGGQSGPGGLLDQEEGVPPGHQMSRGQSDEALFRTENWADVVRWVKEWDRAV